MSRLYEVYLCKLDGEIVYIGQGLRGRSRHCLSGTSHVYDLNKLHFSEYSSRVSVEIYSFYSEQSDALEVEKELILKYRPEFNSVYLDTERQKSASKVVKMKSKIMNDVPSKVWLHTGHGEKYSKTVDELFRFHLVEDVVSDDFVLLDKNFYSKHGFNMLSNLVRKAYDSESNHWKDVLKRNLIKYTGLKEDSLK